MKKPQPLWAVVCENGKVYVDEDDLVYMAHDAWGAEEYLDMLGHSGWNCPCKGHRIVAYEAKKEGS